MPLASSASDTDLDTVNADVAAAESTDANQVAAATSDAGDNQDAKGPTSLLEAVSAAIAPEPKPEESSPSKDGVDSEAEDEDADKADETKAEDDKPPPFHKHPAWQKRLEKERELTATIDDLRPKAERFDQMAQMMSENNLASEEVTAGFNIMALMKNNPAEALKALQPYLATLQKVTGEVLPDDLREAVEGGSVSEDIARETSRLRAERIASEARDAEAAKASEARAADNLMREMAGAVSKWEGDWQGSDPDYAKKQPLVKAQVIALRAERGNPKNAAEAVELAKEARKMVEKHLGSVIPRTKPAVAVVTGASSARATAKPATLQEAIDQGLRRSA